MTYDSPLELKTAKRWCRWLNDSVNMECSWEWSKLIEEVVSFDPTGKVFVYNLDKYSCFRKLTGKCSLDLTEEDVKQYAEKEGTIKSKRYSDYDRTSVYYCRMLAEDIKINGVTQYVWLHPHNCDHYAFTWGQHRTCIAKTIGLNNIPALIGDKWNSECRVCYFRNKNLSFKIKHWLGKSNEFIR
jgi:hypothetical protein